MRNFLNILCGIYIYIHNTGIEHKKKKINWIRGQLDQWCPLLECFSVTSLRGKHPPQHTGCTSSPYKNSRLSPTTASPQHCHNHNCYHHTLTHTHTHCLEPNDAVGHHSPWDLWEGMFWTVNGKDVSLCSWCRSFIFKWPGVSKWPSVYLTWLSLWENIPTILRTTRLRDKPSLWLFGDGLQADPPACFNLSWELWQEIWG